jgi:hypothetical protein
MQDMRQRPRKIVVETVYGIRALRLLQSHINPYPVRIRTYIRDGWVEWTAYDQPRLATVLSGLYYERLRVEYRV